ncbi:fatty acid desaturase family protein [Synechococcus sp. PCC 6312]|uniref:fatty acid desaturase family protein n=1 Tax=Synechococcus sp. (strain ATCC 27167 / PCC 6312) TaxID=195253 RepID=UPI0002D96930|nr:fatty acid desaturase family protein [Synechococcus sp. PCC 6312]
MSNSSTLPPLKPQLIIPTAELKELNQRSDWRGSLQLLTHLIVMVASGIVWGAHLAWAQWWIALPAGVIYGFSLASMFATLHETSHRTAFASNAVNDAVAWFAGILCFYNSTFYRRYHKWHHRYTQLPGQDPELEDPKPTNWREYLWEVSGIPWWLGKIKGHTQIALGKLENCPYIPAEARPEVIRSIRFQLLVYVLFIGISLALHQPWFLTYWLIPLALGQPILRAILLAEHTGCTYDANPLTNTRTTYTIWPIRLLMWNMPYHAEHHLYASIPFHALAKAHEKIKANLTEIEPGYIAANRKIIDSFQAAQAPS